MKNLWDQRHLHIIPIIFCVFLSATPGCGIDTKDLTRESARKLIEDSERFKAPLVASLKDQNEFPMLPNSADETEQEALARVLDMHLSSNIALAVLRHLGYAEVKVTLVKHAKVEGSGPFANIQPWVFNIAATLTDKGRQAAKFQGLTGDKAVPLARREIVEVTGIRKEGIRGEADFTWKTVPTEAGEAFDPSTDTFKSLPPELREALTKSRGIGPFASSATGNWADIHKTSAAFQKYDDGWRLTGIRN
ncbi:MAG TPA: hypothetical protein VF538_13635 [Pyrinomonadaceae bacterium]|jgi:hypothetical protein